MVILSNSAMHCIGQTKTPLKIIVDKSIYGSCLWTCVLSISVSWLSWANELWALQNVTEASGYHW